jgi:PAS domain S-box-containing protein
MGTAQKTILLVEDEAIIALHTARRLQQEGYAVVHAYSGDEAIAKVQAARPAIDLILMDIDLGRGRDGTEAARIILQDHDLPIIFLSSHVELEIIAKTEKIASYGYVIKNTGIIVLVASIKMAFELHAAHQALRLANEKLLQEVAARRQADVELQNEKTFLDTIFDASYDTIFIFDPLSGRPLRWNRRFAEVSGYSDEEIAGMTAPAAFYDEEDLRRANQATASTLAEGRATVELSLVTKSGERIPFEYVATTIHTGAGRVLFVSIGRDITARKRVEEALQRQNEYLAALQDISLDLVSRLELTNLLESIVKRAGQLVGTTAGFLDLVDEETGQLLPHVGVGALTESLKFQAGPGEGIAGTVWQTGRPLVINDYDAWQNRVVGFGRGLFRSIVGVPLQSGSQVVGVLGLAHEYETGKTFEPEVVELLNQFARLATLAIENARLFTASQRELAERKQAEKALQKSQELLNATGRIAQVGGWEIAPVTQALTWTEEVYRIHEVAADFVPDVSTAIDFYAPESRPIIARAVQRAVEQGEPFDVQLQIVTAKGNRRWVHAIGQVEQQGGKVSRVFGVFQDITARRLAEEELRAALAEKEVLLKEVYHRVKNNLASINSLIDLQCSALVDPASVAMLTELGNRVRAMALVHQLLYQSATLSSIDVHNYLTALVSHLRTVYASLAPVHLRVEAPGVEMDLDTAIPCGLIVNELVTNAFKYAFPPGSLRSGAQPCEIFVSVAWDGVRYLLTVSDNGVGLPADFDWTQPTSLGLNLMLLMGREQLRGRIEVERTGGTTFRLWFAPR